MAATISRIDTRNQDGSRTEMFEVMTGTGRSTAIRLQGTVIVQLSGTATDITAWVEHATRDPNTGEVNWAPAEDDAFTGDLSAGMAPRPYDEPAVGWWSVRVASLTGGNVKVSIIGEAA